MVVIPWVTTASYLGKKATTVNRGEPQKRAWWMSQMGKDPGGVHAPTAYRIMGNLNLHAFNRAVSLFVDRHEAFKIFFQEEQGEVRQVIANTISIEMPFVDLTQFAEDFRGQNSKLMQQLSCWVAEGINVLTAPLLRLGLIKLNSHEHIFFFMSHALIFDGWCFDITINEISELYKSECAQRPSTLLPLELHYPDYAAWSSEHFDTHKIQAEVKFWCEYLKGAPVTLYLPTDKVRPRIAESKAQGCYFSLQPECLAAMRKIAQEYETTMFSIIMTSFAYLLGQVANTRDVLIGVPVRDRHSPELEKMIGRFVSTSVFRAQLNDNHTFAANLRQIAHSVQNTLSHESIPFEEVLTALNIRQDRSRPALYQSSFSYQDVRNRVTHIGDCEVRQIVVDHPAVQGDIGIWVKETEQALDGELVYPASLYLNSSIEQLKSLFVLFMENISLYPEKNIAELFETSVTETCSPSLDSLVWVKRLERLIVDCLKEYSDIQDSYVGAFIGDNGKRELRVFFTADPENIPTSSEIRQHLRETLSAKLALMFPNMPEEDMIVLVRSILPRSMDYRAAIPRDLKSEAMRQFLLQGEAEGHGKVTKESPRGDIELKLADIWQTLVKGIAVTRTDNFFDIGGTSLQSLEMLRILQQQFGVIIPATEIVLSNLSQISASIAEKIGRGHTQ